MMAAGLGEFYLTAERSVFMDIWRIQGGEEGRRGGGNTGTKGRFRDRMVEGGRGGAHIQALYKRKRSIPQACIHTHMHTIAVTA